MLWALYLLLLFTSFATCALENTRVDRVIDISTHIARTHLAIEVFNSGATPASEYVIAVAASHAAQLALISSNAAGAQLQVNLVPNSSRSDVVEYNLVGFNAPAGATSKLTVTMVFTGLITPHPASIAQNENQLVKYTGGHHFVSPYPTKKQTTVVKLASSVLQSRSKFGQVSVDGDMLTYGPYIDVPAWSMSAKPLFVHYENNSPFIQLTSVVREVEVSQASGVTMEESYTLKHGGAKLKGGFSRRDYQYNPKMFGASSFNSVTAHLPPSASNIYYRDLTGNISTSQVTMGKREIELELFGRFPMYGGWRNQFCTGYTLEHGDAISISDEDPSVYVMNMTFNAHVSKAVAERVTLKVALPSGAYDATLSVDRGLQIEQQSNEWRHSYLSINDQLVIVAHASNLVPEHSQHFQVRYRLRATVLSFNSMATLFGLVLLAWCKRPRSPQFHEKSKLL